MRALPLPFKPCASRMVQSGMMPAPLRPDLTAVTDDVSQRLRLLTTSLRVSDLCITRPSVVAYFRTFEPDKLELAFVHALDVGVAELLARRRPR